MKKPYQKRINVLIPNASSPKNPGDQAILSVLISLVKRTHPTASIIVHTADPHLYTNTKFNTKHTLYSWSVFDDRRVITRSFRILKLVLQYLLLRMGIDYEIRDKNLSALVADYKKADLILFVGGGYLRSKTGITQSLNLLMQVFIFRFASLFPAKKIAGPISIGPFGYAWHEKAVMLELNKMDQLAIREGVSLAMVKKHSLKNSVLSPDHALMTQKKQIKRKKYSRRKITIGFTIRPWLKGEKQTDLETSVHSALDHFARLTGARIQPITQVDAPEYGEDDNAATTAITNQLLNKDAHVLRVKRIHTVADALRIYADLDLLLGMRMHSNILAAIVGTPFVAISYEHKTDGMAKQLGMKKYCISCETVDSKRLSTLLYHAYTNRKSLSKQLERKIKIIRKTEAKQWNSYLSL